MVSIIIFQGYFKVSLHLWWGGNSYKKSKMLIFSLWGGNQGFLSHWGCWWGNITIFSCQSFFLGTLGKSSRASCNKGVYYSFKIFSCFWLVKTTCIIHHKTRCCSPYLESIFAILNQWHQKWSVSRIIEPVTSKCRQKCSPPQIIEPLTNTSLCYIWLAEKLRE